VKPPLAFVPIAIFASYPGGYLAVPGVKTLVEQLSHHFDIRLAPIGGRENSAPPTRRAAISNIRRALVDGCHVVAMGWHTTEALLAVDGLASVRSFVSLGFQPTPATLRRAGMTTVADAYESMIFVRASSSYPMLRHVFRGVPDDKLHAIHDTVEKGTDRQEVLRYYHWLNSVDLFEERPSVRAPALYLHSPLDMPGIRGMFENLVPQAETDQLQSFPTNLMNPRAGREPAAKVISFINRLASRETGTGRMQPGQALT
jgi:hypothetical protein